MSTLGYGATVAVIGICTVFVGLILLILCVMIMGKIFEAATKPKAPKQAAAAAPAPVPAPAPVATPVVEEAPVETDPQLIAVIAAAIAAFEGSNKTLLFGLYEELIDDLLNSIIGYAAVVAIEVFPILKGIIVVAPNKIVGEIYKRAVRAIESNIAAHLGKYAQKQVHGIALFAA